MSNSYPPNWLPEWIAAAEDDDHAHGVHSYADLANGCLRRTHLRSPDGEDMDGGSDATFGTHCHAWLKAYHDHEPWPFLEPTHDDTCSEQFLMENYARRFAPESLGETILSEQRLFGTLRINGITYPIAGTLDRITCLTAEDVILMVEQRGVVLEPGIYIHDFKTARQKGAMTLPRHMEGDQHTLYYELLRQNFPDLATEFKGTLFHLLYRYKKDEDKSFQTVKVEPPTAAARLRLRSLIVDGTTRLASLGPGHMSAGRCFDWNRMCPIMRICERSNLSVDLSGEV